MSPAAGAGGDRLDRPAVVLAVCAAAYLPFTLLGYGTDIDVANVLRAGHTWLDDGVYEMSRRPGTVLHEVGTALLDRVGGSVLVNATSVAFALLALWSVHRLLARDGARWPGWVALVVAANPWFWLAATSLGDFVWALGLVLGGAVAASRERHLLAGALFGLSIGMRLSTVLVVGAWLVAERTGERAQRTPWTATARTVAVTALVGALCFVPPWLQADRSLDFLDSGLDFAGWGVSVGRWAVKNAAVIGVPAAVVLLIGLPRIAGAFGRWRTSTLVRFAVLAAVSGELLFLRLPLKPVHLLPVVVAVALLVGASPRVQRSLLVALVAAQLVGGVVGATFGAPDVPHRATTGRLDVAVTEGPLLNAVRCRMEDRERGAWPDPAGDADARAAAHERARTNFDCQSETWRGDGSEADVEEP